MENDDIVELLKACVAEPFETMSAKTMADLTARLRAALPKDSEESNSYSMNVVNAKLKAVGLGSCKPTQRSDALGLCTGGLVKINDDRILSIQTSPDVAGCSFVEVAHMDGNKKLLNDDDYVLRFDTPEEFYEHIDEVVKRHPKTST